MSHRRHVGQKYRRPGKWAKRPVRTCRRCGCTDAQACPGGCAWMPGLDDVCTACATPAELIDFNKGKT